MSRFEDENLHSESFQASVYDTLKQAYGPFLFRIGISFVIGLMGRGLLLANANLIGLWVDSKCMPPAQCRPLPTWVYGFTNENFVWLLGGFVLGGFALTLLFRVLFSRVSAMAVSRIYDEVTFRTSRFPARFFDVTPAGRIVTRFSSDYGNVFRLFGGPLAEFIAIVFDLTMMVVLIGIASPYYLIIVAFIALLNLFIYRFNIPSLRKARRLLSASRSPSIALFAETSQGASTIRSFRKETSFFQRFSELDKYFLEKKMGTFTRMTGFALQMNGLSAIFLLITGVAAYFLIKNNSVSVGSVGVAFSFILLSGATLQMFFEWLTQFEEAMIGVERLDRYLRRPIEPGSLLPLKTQFQTTHDKMSAEGEKRFKKEKFINKNAASVQFKDVHFRYAVDLPWILKGVSFDLSPGERLGIVGRTGSGKSSLIQALFYLYPTEKGEILIDGKRPNLQMSAKDLEGPNGVSQYLTSYRKSIAYVSQDPTLFKGSLRFNLDPGNEHLDTELIEALKRVGLDSWFTKQGENLNYQIHERGKNVSLGERQLVCLARCLLQDAPVVVMDEATSSVDPQSEEIMVKATEKFFQGRTQIIIAHRLSTLEKCDRILWLMDGRVQAMGKKDEVLSVYRQQPEVNK